MVMKKKPAFESVAWRETADGPMTDVHRRRVPERGALPRVTLCERGIPASVSEIVYDAGADDGPDCALCVAIAKGVQAASAPNKIIPRLARLLGDIGVEKDPDGRGWLINIPGDPLPTYARQKWSAVAFLADIARFRELDPSSVRFTGSPPSRGLAAWEESAIQWLNKEGS